MTNVPINSFTVVITATDAKKNVPTTTAFFTATSFDGEDSASPSVLMYDKSGKPVSYQFSEDPTVPTSSRWLIIASNVDPQFALFSTRHSLDLTTETSVDFVVTPAQARPKG